MPKLTIDGVEIEAREGQNLLQAALEHGIHIPHLCFHPRLQVAGNCRMCLVEVEKVPKLQIACGTTVRDGMRVTTNNERVRQVRRAMLEFLLINHPLDCPTCDQSGECRLQDYTFEYGQAQSRYREEKRTFPAQNLGRYLVRNMNRCIHCTRCIRFLRDAAGSEEFSLFERSLHTQVGPYLERAVESPFSLNLAEICPVGALTSRPFRFKGRVWLLHRVRTLCPGCSRGCNVFAWSWKGKLLRLTPAENQLVNLSWLCDFGRMTVERVHAKDRLLTALRLGDPIEPQAALDQAAARLRQYLEQGQAGAVGVILSPRLSNEDNYLVRKLAREVIGTRRLALVPGASAPDRRPFGPSPAPLTEWFLREDQNPNTRGAQDILRSTEHEEDAARLIAAGARGELKTLLVFGEDPVTSLGDPDRVREALLKLELLLVVDAHKTQTADLAQLAIPEASFAEKDGTFTNEQGRVQRLTPAIGPVADGRPAWQTAQDLARRLGASWSFQSAAAILEEIAAKVPGYQDLEYGSLPPEGRLTTPA